MSTAQPSHNPLLVALLGCLSLAVAMGAGRFAFTALFPTMVAEGRLSIADGSVAATANYAGYLIGAVALVRFTPLRAPSLCLLGLAVTAICLFGMDVASSKGVIIAIRLVAGMASAVVMIAVTIWLMREARGNQKAAPLLYAGVGIGITCSAELSVLAAALDWRSRTVWMVLAMGALFVTMVIAAATRRQPRPPTQPTRSNIGANAAGGQGWRPDCHLTPAKLIWIYGLAGFGYIVSATYLPLIVDHALGPALSLHLWAAFGLGAAPSCLLWHMVHVRFGTGKAIAANFGIQALGVLIPTMTADATLLVLGAALVGATFMGVVTIVMPAARTLATGNHAALASAMTASYGLGQILGPIVAQILFRLTHGFSWSLVVAASLLIIGGTGASLQSPARTGLSAEE